MDWLSKGFQPVSLGFTKLDRVLLGLTGFSLAFDGCFLFRAGYNKFSRLNWVHLRFYWVLPGMIRFLLGFTGFLLGFIRFDWTLLGFTGFYQV